MLSQIPLAGSATWPTSRPRSCFWRLRPGAYITGETLHVNGGMLMD